MFEPGRTNNKKQESETQEIVYLVFQGLLLGGMLMLLNFFRRGCTSLPNSDKPCNRRAGRITSGKMPPLQEDKGRSRPSKSRRTIIEEGERFFWSVRSQSLTAGSTSTRNQQIRTPLRGLRARPCAHTWCFARVRTCTTLRRVAGPGGRDLRHGLVHYTGPRARRS